MKCKKAKERKVDTTDVLYEEWDFCSFDCAIRSIVDVAVVCGDEIRLGYGEHAGTIEIYNHHKQGVRLRGFIKE